MITRALSSLLLLSSLACTTVPVEVLIEPPDVAMQAVSAGGTPARRSADGRWQADVDRREVADGRVTLEGRSEGGLHVVGEGTLTPGEGGAVVLNIPAEIEVQVGPGQASQVLVGGRLIEPRDGAYLARVPAGRGPIIAAANGTSGMRDQASLDPVPGQRTTVRLELDVLAAFSVVPAAPRFGEPITFDASASAPADRLDSYLWDFGDGHTAEGPLVTHVFPFDPSVHQDTEHYAVTLSVAAGEKYSHAVTQQVPVRQDRPELRLDVALFPERPGLHHALGEPVQFVLERVPSDEGARPEEARLSFGDGTSLALDPALLMPEAPARPLIVEHTYAAEGRFQPRLTFTDATTRAGDRREAVLRREGALLEPLVVTRAYPTTAELAERAWERLGADLVAQVERAAAGLDERPDVALTWLPDANYQERDPLALATVERLTEALVAAGHPVLERRSQVLTRLAHEALVAPGVVGAAADAPRRGSLDLALAPGHNGPDQPLVFDGALVTQEAGGHAPLVARFDAADLLLAVELLDGTPRYEQERAVAFHDDLGLPLDRHRVQLSLRLRLVDRRGRILDTLELASAAEDLAAQGLRPGDAEPGPLR